MSPRNQARDHEELFEFIRKLKKKTVWDKIEELHIIDVDLSMSHNSCPFDSQK